MAESSLIRVENTVKKGEIAHSEQFLLLPQFSRLDLQTCKNKGLFGKGSNEIFIMSAVGYYTIADSNFTIYCPSIQTIRFLHSVLDKTPSTIMATGQE